MKLRKPTLEAHFKVFWLGRESLGADNIVRRSPRDTNNLCQIYSARICRISLLRPRSLPFVLSGLVTDICMLSELYFQYF